MNCAALVPVHSIKADYSDDQTYVLKLATAPIGGQVIVAAALSNRKVKLYSFDGTNLQHFGDLDGHQGVLTDLVFPIEGSPESILTSSQDGTVKMWDARNMSCTATYKAEGKELHCCSIGRGANSIAAGTEGAVLFWDRRSARPQGSFTDSFAEDVTQVKFYPGSDSILLAGDVDGLCCVFDTSKQLNEDVAFRACANIGTSVAEMGFFGPKLEKVWMRSTTESLHLWEWAAAMTEAGSEGAGELRIENAREQCSAAATAIGFTPLDRTDYLIGCEYSPTEDALYLMAGNCEGPAGAFRVEGRAGPSGEAMAGVGPQMLALHGAHEEVVRSVLWPLASGHHVISGAEDSRIVVWGPPGSTPGASVATGGVRAAKETEGMEDGDYERGVGGKAKGGKSAGEPAKGTRPGGKFQQGAKRTPY